MELANSSAELKLANDMRGIFFGVLFDILQS